MAKKGLRAWVKENWVDIANKRSDGSYPKCGRSGGEKRKMALSVGLSSSAEFLLWDEPTNHLDIETIERFEDELLSSKKTYMIISHDRYLLNHTTDNIFHIDSDNILFENINNLAFSEDNAYRAENSLKQVPMDTRLIKALEHGLPQCAGVALGIDRLVMLATNKEKIKDVIAFDVQRA